MRLDQYLQKQFPSRNKAKEAIQAGRVLVDGKPVTKPSFELEEGQDVQVKEVLEFVSRSGYKLEGAFKNFDIDVKDQVVLDIGASTGGFSQCVLNHGAAKVYALDVGHLQLSDSLKNDPRLVNMEGRNARYIETDWFDDPIDFVCMDVSFISSRLILEPMFEKFVPEHLALLVKPQFEVDPSRLNKRGIIKNEKIRVKAIEDVAAFLKQTYRDVQVMDSVLAGKEGNLEAIVYARSPYDRTTLR